MSIAYFIMAHHKPNQLVRLLNAIYDEDNVYLIHVDESATEEMHGIMKDLSDMNENIYVLPSRNVNWGGWSLVQIEIDAIRYLLSLNREWSHYINLSGQDYPLISQKPLKEILASKATTNFLQFSETDLKADHFQHIQNYFYVEDRGEIKQTVKRDPFTSYFDFKAYHGSQWRMITRDCARESVDSPLAIKLQDYFRYTMFPDENYFQTVIMNSQFAPTVTINNHRLLEFAKSTVGILEINRPITFTKNHFLSLVRTGKFFARKFDEDVDSEIFDLIDGYLAL